MASLCSSLGGVEVCDVTFADAVSPTVPDDLEGEGSWMLALVQESSSSSAGKLIMQTKGLPTLPVNPNSPLEFCAWVPKSAGKLSQELKECKF